MPSISEVRKAEDIGYAGRHERVWLACEDCGKERWIDVRVYKKGKYKICGSCSMSGRRNKNWKGGRTRSSDGYITILLHKENPYYSMATTCNKRASYIMEHRLVMAKHLSRCLTSKEIVHHINGDKHDNRLENLYLTTKKDHIKGHLQGYQDGYIKGYQDGQTVAMRELRAEIRLLRFMVQKEADNSKR